MDSLGIFSVPLKMSKFKEKERPSFIKTALDLSARSLPGTLRVLFIQRATNSL